jgi:hypothetical protein
MEAFFIPRFIANIPVIYVRQQEKVENAESKLPDDPYQSGTGPKFAIKLLSFNSFLLSLSLRSHLEKVLEGHNNRELDRH